MLFGLQTKPKSSLGWLAVRPGCLCLFVLFKDLQWICDGLFVWLCVWLWGLFLFIYLFVGFISEGWLYLFVCLFQDWQWVLVAGMAGGGRLPATHYRKSADRQLGRTKLSGKKDWLKMLTSQNTKAQEYVQTTKKGGSSGVCDASSSCDKSDAVSSSHSHVLREAPRKD